MSKKIFTILYINFIVLGNQMIYSLKSIPILRNIISDKLYKSRVVVLLFSLLGIIKVILKEFLFNFMVILILYFIPFIIKDNNSNVSFYTSFIFLSIMISIILNKTFKANESKYNVVTMLKFNPKIYCILDLFKNLILTSIIAIPSFIIIKFGFNINLFWIIFNFIISYLFVNLFQLYIYSKKGYVLQDNGKRFILVLGLLIIFTFLLPILNISISKMIFIIFNILLFLFSIILLFWYYKSNSIYKLYKERFTSYINVIDDDVMMANNFEKRIKLNDKVVYSDKVGYEKFNDIFLVRHESILKDSTRVYSIILSIIFGLIIVSMLFFKPTIKIVNVILNSRYLYFVLIIYFTNRGQDITKSMYYHCDNAMLKYNFYRNRNTIINLFKIRLMSLIKLNLPITLITTISLSIMLILSDFSFGKLLCISISTILISIFFSYYYLILYYLIQPYSNSMKQRSSKYNIIIFITYFLIYELAVEFNINLYIATLSIIGSTIILFILLYILFIKNVDKTFKLRNE